MEKLLPVEPWIWKKKGNAKEILEQLNAAAEPTVHTPLGINYTEIGSNYLEASMPVDERTRQPMGLLHGGASVLLAESLGSLASYLVVGLDGKTICLGLEINASHLRSMQAGAVIGRASSIRIGRTIHVWTIAIRDANTSFESPRLISQARLSVLVKPISSLPPGLIPGSFNQQNGSTFA